MTDPRRLIVGVVVLLGGSCRSAWVLDSSTSGSGGTIDPAGDGTTGESHHDDATDDDDTPYFDLGDPSEPNTATVALVVYAGMGQGQFGAPIDSEIPPLLAGPLDERCHGIGSQHVIAAGFDFDGDGASDVAVGTGQRFALAFGDGAFGFDDLIDDTPLLDDACGWTAGKIFGGPTHDLVAISCTDSSVLVYRGGQRALGAPFGLPGGLVTDVAVADFDQNGLDEIVVSSVYSDDEAVEFVETFAFSDGGFIGRVDYGGLFLRSLRAISPAGNASPDLFIVEGNNSPTQVVRLSDWESGSVEVATADWGENCVSCPRIYGDADFDGDGFADLVMTGSHKSGECGHDDAVAILSAGLALPHFAAVSRMASFSYSRALAVGDVDGDGRPDLLSLTDADGDDEPRIVVAVNRTEPGAIELAFDAVDAVYASPGYATFHAFELHDVDGDGRLDLVALVSTMDPA